jgi:hypothetical protein
MTKPKDPKDKKPHTKGYNDRASIISVEKYNEMYAAYNERQTIRHVARVCQVNQITARKYIEEGDWNRKLPAIKARWEKTQQQAQMAEDYTIVKARREVQTVARAFMQRVAKRISELNPKELSADKLISQLQTTQAILERTLGVSDATVSIKQEDPFHGWTTEDLLEFARSGTLPEYARGADSLASQASARRKLEEE